MGVMFAPFVETLLAVCSDPSGASGRWQERGVVEQHQAEAVDDVGIGLRARAAASGRLDVGDGEPQFSTPSSCASRLAASINLGEASTPTANPSGPANSANRLVVSPNPQPTSSMRSPCSGR